MRIHYIMHAAFEKLGAIENWVKDKNYYLSGTHTYLGEQLPSANEFDFLIVMGGPQSPRKLEEWPYLKNEILLIKDAIRENKSVLGFCLGAQLIAESLGANTLVSPHREIGVFPIELLSEAKQDPLFSLFPTTFPVMHWHNDMPGIPNGARLLAKSKGCPQQAFGFGDRVYGLQFHLEMTPANINEMVFHCEHELTDGSYVEAKQQLLAHELTEINQKLFLILDYLSETAITQSNKIEM